MPAATEPHPPEPTTTHGTRTPWAALRVTHDVTTLEGEWRDLETRALATPYQAYDWIASFAATVGRAQAMDLRFVQVLGPAGETLAMLPLVITRRHGTRFAEFIGGKHANYHMAMFETAFAQALDATTSQALLLAIGETLADIDAFVFINQPTHWNGVANPFALLAASASPSLVYKLKLIAGAPDATLRRSMSKHARKKLTTKRNRFAELGPSALVRATDVAGIERILGAFLRQKAARFAMMGVPDPFADPSVKAFLRQAALDDGVHPPAIELYSLDLAGRCVATYVAAQLGDHISGMATSFDMTSDAARFSPGELLLLDLISAKCHEGLEIFDLGVGEARYKTTICDDSDRLVDTFLPLTAKGRGYAWFSRAKRAVKRRIKASPLALKVAQRVSGWFGRRRRAIEAVDD